MSPDAARIVRHPWILTLVGFLLAAVLEVACPITADAQSVDAVVTTGRTFNYVTGEWTLAQSPSVEVTAGPWTSYVTLHYDRTGLFERDLGVYYTRAWKRVTVTSDLGVYFYPGGWGRDWTWSTSVRLTLWQRQPKRCPRMPSVIGDLRC